MFTDTEEPFIESKHKKITSITEVIGQLKKNSICQPAEFQ